METHNMPRQDTIDFVTAFAVGAVLGIGTALLLQPDRSPQERVKQQWKPYRKQMQKSYGETRHAVGEAAHATGDMTTELVSAGRELLTEFRSEAAKILKDTRSDLEELTQDQVKELSKQLKRSRKKLGL